MKIVLNRDIRGVGKVGEVCTVADGYGRNYLLPKGYAVIANKKNLENVQQKMKELQSQNDKNLQLAKEIADILGNEVFNLVRQAADDDTIYGSIRTKDVYELINSFLKKNNKDFTFDIGGIDFDKIKSLGQYLVNVSLFGEVSTTIRLNVCRIASDFETSTEAFDKKREASLHAESDDGKKSGVLVSNTKIIKAEIKKAKAESKKNEKNEKNENKEDKENQEISEKDNSVEAEEKKEVVDKENVEEKTTDDKNDKEEKKVEKNKTAKKTTTKSKKEDKE